MDELDKYGGFNTRYEGAGELLYVSGPSLPVYFDARQLLDGRLLVGCVSPKEAIRESPTALSGRLLSGESFDTIWGRGLHEIYRPDEGVPKAHYVAGMTRVRYTKDVQPSNRSVRVALHNFIPGKNANVSPNGFTFEIKNQEFATSPVGNYGDQASRLLRHGGNLRTSWMDANLSDESGNMLTGLADLDDIAWQIVDAISLAVGTLVTAPQKITYDCINPSKHTDDDHRNDVEHFTSEAKAFSKFIPSRGWDTPIVETIEAWFSAPKPLSCFGPTELAVWIRQHLDACATDIYLETRALAAASLLDVVAGRYRTVWAPQAPAAGPPYFRERLKRLLTALGIPLSNGELSSIINARNKLVHAGKFVSDEHDKIFENLVCLGRCILLRIAGVPSRLYESIQA